MRLSEGASFPGKGIDAQGACEVDAVNEVVEVTLLPAMATGQSILAVPAVPGPQSAPILNPNKAFLRLFRISG